jgi:hypothetical protein
MHIAYPLDQLDLLTAASVQSHGRRSRVLVTDGAFAVTLEVPGEVPVITLVGTWFDACAAMRRLAHVVERVPVAA